MAELHLDANPTSSQSDGQLRSVRWSHSLGSSSQQLRVLTRPEQRLALIPGRHRLFYPRPNGTDAARRILPAATAWPILFDPVLAAVGDQCLQVAPTLCRGHPVQYGRTQTEHLPALTLRLSSRIDLHGD